jgi:hypothetical protein
MPRDLATTLSFFVLVNIVAFYGCGSATLDADAKKSAIGEGCQKSADCTGDLACVGGVCAKPGTTIIDAGSEDTDAAGTPEVVQTDGQVNDDIAAPTDACASTCLPGACVDGCGKPCGVTCSDGSACTMDDACKAGVCVGQAIACDDKNSCTDEACDPGSGCKHTPNAASCDDDNPCTVGDACKDGTCQPGKAKDCALPGGDACVVGKCSITGGKCKFSDAVDGTSCDDGSACSIGDACKTGACSGQKLECDDKNPCTADTCDMKTGCMHQNVTAGCDDGNGCTESDLCKDGSCLSGTVKACDDGAPCTKDVCNLKTGACVSDAAPFEGTGCDADGSACTVGDICSVGVCKPGNKVNCDDSNACTSDSCDVKMGCQNVAVTGSCNADDNACTGDTCTGGICKSGAPKACSDGNPCTIDACDVKTGLCTFSALSDGTSCDADGSKCTDKDACKAGACVPGGPLNCDDANVCTDDGCLAATGCSHSGVTKTCDADGDACTSGDACKNSTCLAGPLLYCDDGNPCTDDTCDSKAGCTHTANTAACNDGDPCTNDKCTGGKCVATAFACDPCKNYGGTAITVTAQHMVVCGSALTNSQFLAAKFIGGWHQCSLLDVSTWAPAKTIAELAGQAPWRIQMSNCSEAACVTNDSSKLNSQSSYICYGYLCKWSDGASVLACHD